MTGTVALVGAGPGAADLLTLRAARLIAQADWLIHDALVGGEVLALATRARRYCVGKRAGRRSVPQARTNRLMIACAARGGLVVRLKGGDPMLFARASEEIAALRAAGVAFEIVPGITSAQAAHAALTVPMTDRDTRRSVVLATPQVARGREAGLEDTSWARALANAGGGAVYMAASASARIRALLLTMGMPASTPVSWVSDASLPSMRIEDGTLGTLSPPAAWRAGAATLLLVGTRAARRTDPLYSAQDEPPATPVCARDRSARPEPDSGRARAAHLAAGALEGDP
ncbi:MAG: uroporphyrinogen-III C-methyltransferase [Lautropia sp.]